MRTWQLYPSLFSADCENQEVNVEKSWLGASPFPRGTFSVVLSLAHSRTFESLFLLVIEFWIGDERMHELTKCVST